MSPALHVLLLPHVQDSAPTGHLAPASLLSAGRPLEHAMLSALVIDIATKPIWRLVMAMFHLHVVRRRELTLLAPGAAKPAVEVATRWRSIGAEDGTKIA